MKPPKEYLKNLKHHTITEKMLSDCIYSINNRALNSRDNEYKYTHYIPNTYGNAFAHSEDGPGYAGTAEE